MNWLENIIYGFVSGLTEFLPVSGLGHRAVLLHLFGAGQRNAFQDLLIHVAVLAALVVNSSFEIQSLYREKRLADIPKRRRSRQPDMKRIHDIMLVKQAFFSVWFGFCFYPLTGKWQEELHMVALFLLVNGILLYIPQFVRTGNKESRHMSGLDSLLFGLGGALSVFPGVSRVAGCTTVASLRGADREHALRWTFLLSIPAIAFLLGFDLHDLVYNGAGMLGFVSLLQYTLSAITAYLGAYLAIMLMRFLSVNAGYSAFAFYSWGFALFAFILYLI